MAASPIKNARTKEPRRFPSRLPRLRWFVVSAVMLVAGVFIYQIYELLYETIPDMYAQEWVAGMVFIP